MTEHTTQPSLQPGEPDPGPEWHFDDTGHGLAILGPLTLRVYLMAGPVKDEREWWWGIYWGELKRDTINQSGEQLGGCAVAGDDVGVVRGRTKEEAIALAAAAAMDWLNGIDRFVAGDEILVEIGWLADFLGVREDLDRAGEDPRTEITLSRGAELPEDADPSESPWDCASRIADIHWHPDSDEQAAHIADGWARYLEWRQVAELSAEQEAERLERVQGALDAAAAMGDDDEQEPEPEEELEPPDRKPDEVRPATLLALVELSTPAKLNLADLAFAKIEQVREERESARAAAAKTRERINKLVEEEEDLSKRYRRGGDMEPRPHRVELYFAEKLAVVRREDTGKVTDVRALLPHERQGQLPLEDGGGEHETEGQGDELPPYPVTEGQVLISRDSGRRVKVLELLPDHQVRYHKLTKDGDVDGRAKPHVTELAALYKAYQPVMPPTEGDGPPAA
jgi:hypothetical protein